MPSVAILTPDPESHVTENRWKLVYDLMHAPLTAAGLAVKGLPWTQAEDLTRFDLVMPLVAWGYYSRAAEWIEAVTKWEQGGVRLLNPPDVLRWNTDKRYLERLAEAGAPSIPTEFVDRVTQGAVDAAFARFGCERLVIKPQVSAGAYRTLRLKRGDSLEEGPKGAALIQPYLEAIESEGETSLFFFNGAFSHAVAKAPKAGDFRVQPEWGGRIANITPPPSAIAAAAKVLEAVHEDLLYARIDLVRIEGETWGLVEAELIEPELYLAYAPDRGAAFARAVVGRIERA